MTTRIVSFVLMAGFAPCVVSCGGATSGGSQPSVGRGGSSPVSSVRDGKDVAGEIDLVTDRDVLEERECVALGRVLTRGGGGSTAQDLKEQARSLGANVVFVTAYAFKRRHVNYNVKGTAYYCYVAN